ncbi:MAG: hypothetical protein WCZ65_03100 [Lysobacteraceae bacterium]
MNPPPSRPSESSHAFPETRWSLVLGASDPRGRAALGELCLRYWFPVYAYVRRCGHDPASAQDLTAAFFQHLSTRDLRQRAEQAPRFRDYLRGALVAFLAHSSRAARQSAALPAGVPDLETLEQRLHADGTVRSAEATFETSFAGEIIGLALARLHAEAAQAGRLDLFDLLQPHLASDPQAGEYEPLAERAGLRPMTLAMALKRLRSRFRELVDEELAQTVGDPAALAAERAALLAVLGGGEA